LKELHLSQTAPRYGERQFIGCWIDQATREELAERAQLEDRSVSALIRRAIAAELARTNDEGEKAP
jgi:hypothetical protein